MARDKHRATIGDGMNIGCGCLIAMVLVVFVLFVGLGVIVPGCQGARRIKQQVEEDRAAKAAIGMIYVEAVGLIEAEGDGLSMSLRITNDSIVRLDTAAIDIDFFDGKDQFLGTATVTARDLAPQQSAEAPLIAPGVSFEKCSAWAPRIKSILDADCKEIETFTVELKE